jgi:hypothetical protein
MKLLHHEAPNDDDFVSFDNWIKAHTMSASYEMFFQSIARTEREREREMREREREKEGERERHTCVMPQSCSRLQVSHGRGQGHSYGRGHGHGHNLATVTCASYTSRYLISKHGAYLKVTRPVSCPEQGGHVTLQRHALAHLVAVSAMMPLHRHCHQLTQSH